MARVSKGKPKEVCKLKCIYIPDVTALCKSLFTFTHTTTVWQELKEPCLTEVSRLQSKDFGKKMAGEKSPQVTKKSAETQHAQPEEIWDTSNITNAEVNQQQRES